MRHQSDLSIGKPNRAGTLSNPILAVICEHTDQPWEVDPVDPIMAILRKPILDLVREHLPESEPVKPTEPVTKTPAKKASSKAKVDLPGAGLAFSPGSQIEEYPLAA